MNKIQPMTLEQALNIIAVQINADPQELMKYAAEDTLGGYHVEEGFRRFDMGSIWGVEGQILYTLARFLKPDVMVEIGGWAGCSASHFALAARANGKGRVISVDNGIGGKQHGVQMSDEFRQYVSLVQANGQDWLAQQADGSIDLIFEDADHSTSLVALLSHLAMTKLRPGGILVNHDAGHDQAYYPNGHPPTPSTVAEEVQSGLKQAMIDFRVYLVQPSDCGLAITMKQGAVNTASVEQAPVSQAVETGGEDWAAQALKAVPKVDLTRPSAPPTYDPDKGWQGLAPIGNSNIESQSTPPPVESAKDETAAKEQTKPRTPRGKGKRKPSSKAKS